MFALIGLKYCAALLALPLLVQGMSDRVHVGRISEHLTRLTSSRDIETNIQLAEDWLHVKEKPSLMHRIKGSSSSMIEPLSDFVDLRKAIKPETYCTKTSYDIISRNDRNTLGAIPTNGDKVDSDRAMNIIHQVWLAHANQCIPRYPMMFKKSESELNEATRRTVEEITDKILTRNFGEELAPRDPRRLDLTILNSAKNPFIRATRVQIFVNLLTAGGYEDQLNKAMKLADETDQKEELAELAEDALLRPCQEYLDKLNQIFLSRELDMAVLKPAEKDRDFDIEYAYVKVRVCRSLSNNFERLVVSMREFMLILGKKQ